MKIVEITEGVGKIVQGVNTTVDVQPGETERQAKKYFGGDGKPKALGGDDTHKLFNMGLSESEVEHLDEGLGDAWKATKALASLAFPKLYDQAADYMLKLAMRDINKHDKKLNIRQYAYKVQGMTKQELDIEQLIKVAKQKHPKVFA